MPDLRTQVLEILKTVNDPEIGRDLVSLNMVKNIAEANGAVTIDIELTTPACPLKAQIERDVASKVRALPGVRDLKISFGAQVASRPRQGMPMLAQVKNIIAVGSGKGGVGKSTVAANLALALAAHGTKVGLLDLDIYGPSIPAMMGLSGARPVASPEGKILPMDRLGLKVLSYGFFAPPEEATMVRGPILHRIVSQFLEDVAWGDLDYLVVDLPPGTGDVQISLGQLIPLTGVVIVTTPQDVALSVAIRAISMFRQVKAPILGIVENMSSFACPHCGKTTDIFGHGGAKAAAARMGIPFLGEVPLDAGIRGAENEGVPIVRQKPESAQAAAFLDVARRVAGGVSMRNLGAEGGEERDRVLAKAGGLFKAK